MQALEILCRCLTHAMYIESGDVTLAPFFPPIDLKMNVVSHFS
jgi:hypothetical protein